MLLTWWLSWYLGHPLYNTAFRYILLVTDVKYLYLSKIVLFYNNQIYEKYLVGCVR